MVRWIPGPARKKAESRVSCSSLRRPTRRWCRDPNIGRASGRSDPPRCPGFHSCPTDSPTMTRRTPPSRRWRDGTPIPGSRPPPVGPELIPAPWWRGREGVSVALRVPGHAIGKFCAQRASGRPVRSTDTIREYPPVPSGAIGPRHWSRPVPPTRRSIGSPRVGRPREMYGSIASRPR